MLKNVLDPTLVIKAVHIGHNLDHVREPPEGSRYTYRLIAFKVWENDDEPAWIIQQFKERIEYMAPSISEWQLIIYAEDSSEPPRERELTRERDDEEPRVSDVVKLKPTYDLKKVSAQLKDPKLPKERKKKLLLGLHENYGMRPRIVSTACLRKLACQRRSYSSSAKSFPTTALDANSSLMRSIGQG